MPHARHAAPVRSYRPPAARPPPPPTAPAAADRAAPAGCPPDRRGPRAGRVRVQQGHGTGGTVEVEVCAVVVESALAQDVVSGDRSPELDAVATAGRRHWPSLPVVVGSLPRTLRARTVPWNSIRSPLPPATGGGAGGATGAATGGTAGCAVGCRCSRSSWPAARVRVTVAVMVADSATTQRSEGACGSQDQVTCWSTHDPERTRRSMPLPAMARRASRPTPCPPR